MKRLLFMILLQSMLVFACKKEPSPEEKPIKPEVGFEISDHLYAGTSVKSIAFRNPGVYFYSTGSLIMLKDSANKITTYQAGSIVYSMAYNSRDHSLYFGTKESGLGRLHNGNMEYFTVENSGLPRNLISQVICDQSGNIWFNSSASKLGGLIKYNGATIEKFLPENSSIPGNLIYEITASGDDIYLSVADPKGGGTYIMKVRNNKWEQVLRTTGCYVFQNMEIDRDGRLYYLEDSREYCGGGLMSDYIMFSFINGEKTAIREGAAGTEFLPYMIKCDKRNYVWSAKFYKAGYETLSVYNRKEWIKAPSGFPQETIRCMEVDDENSIWLGTDNGIFILKQSGI
jgi:ligand-binding sensor domain-containing protein